MNAISLENTGEKTNAVVLQRKNVIAFAEAYPFERDYLKSKFPEMKDVSYWKETAQEIKNEIKEVTILNVQPGSAE